MYRNLLIQIDRESTQRATCLLANSKYTAQNIQRFYGCSADVSYFGVDTEAFYPIQGTKKDIFLLSVGALEPIKGFDLIIQSIGRLPRSIRPPLKIVGNASNWQEQAYLSDQARVFGVDLKVETMVDHQKLVQLYNETAFLVYTPVREPFGLVPLEAMACGTAVVGVAEGGVLETVIDGVNGRLVSRDPDQLAAVIKSLLEDPHILARFRENTREYVVKQWNWDRAVDALEVLLRNAAAIPKEQRVSK
jgi:glycosyltransferase involved in cell wall biosynthesis